MMCEQVSTLAMKELDVCTTAEIVGVLRHVGGCNRCRNVMLPAAHKPNELSEDSKTFIVSRTIEALSKMGIDSELRNPG